MQIARSMLMVSSKHKGGCPHFHQTTAAWLDMALSRSPTFRFGCWVTLPQLDEGCKPQP